MTLEEYANRAFHEFDFNFMIGEDDEERADFRNRMEAKRMVEDGYRRGIDVLDLLDAMESLYDRLYDRV